MTQQQQAFSRLGFAKAFILPALSVFLVPTLSLLFFLHAEQRFSQEARDGLLKAVAADPNLNADERARAREEVNKLTILALLRNEDVARGMDSTAKLYYWSVIWALRIAIWALISGVLVFAAGGLCVVLSLRSQLVQYLSLSVGWHLLRIFGAFQTVAQGALLVALSFWITALWFNTYVPKLILIVVLLAGAAVFVVLKAIFSTPGADFAVQGKVIRLGESPALWERLQIICDKVGTRPPDQVIAGIDDNFFVTEQPVTVDGTKVEGRTLFISLAMLKHLQSAEADAILAHEMAHFSGNDTLYSRRISPLLLRYSHYLRALSSGVITLPIFYFMLCFRALFELSLTRLSRGRELRADHVAVEATSAGDVAGALLRTSAYSRYRNQVEVELFKNERPLEAANVSERVEQGFPAFAVGFTSDPSLGTATTAHPFDTHPPLAARFEAIGLPFRPDLAQGLLARRGDGGWYGNIDNAEQVEREQWRQFEEGFRKFHEQILAYRFLPDTEEERAIVERAFPEVIFPGKDGAVLVNFREVSFSAWPAPVLFREIENVTLDEAGNLTIRINRGGKSKTETVKTQRLDEKQRALETLSHYHARYLSAVEYQKAKAKVEAVSSAELRR
jgi:Zn-dependent protease with chaperone function